MYGTRSFLSKLHNGTTLPRYIVIVGYSFFFFTKIVVSIHTMSIEIAKKKIRICHKKMLRVRKSPTSDGSVLKFTRAKFVCL